MRRSLIRTPTQALAFSAFVSFMIAGRMTVVSGTLDAFDSLPAAGAPAMPPDVPGVALPSPGGAPATDAAGPAPGEKKFDYNPGAYKPPPSDEVPTWAPAVMALAWGLFVASISLGMLSLLRDLFSAREEAS